MFNKLFRLGALALISGAMALAQLTSTQTTFTAAVPIPSPSGNVVTTVQLASNTGVVTQQNSQLVGTYLYADQEAMQVINLLSAQTCTVNCFYSVKRGVLGTRAAGHATTTSVWVGNQATSTGDPSRPFSNGIFIPSDPMIGSGLGSCVAANLYSLPVINTSVGRVWTCPSTGPLAGYWAVVYDPTALFSVADGAIFLGPGNCSVSASANGTGTAGLQTVGGVAVNQQAVTAIGTNTITFNCHLSLPTRLRGGVGNGVGGSPAGIAVTDVVFVYGVQQAALGTQAAVLASGTFNGTAVFQTATFPAPAAAETQSAAFARADTGSLVITPVAASFNGGTTTAGQFFTAKFAPAVPIIINTDRQDITFNVTLQAAATTATTVNSPGVYVHLIGVPL